MLEVLDAELCLCCLNAGATLVGSKSLVVGLRSGLCPPESDDTASDSAVQQRQ